MSNNRTRSLVPEAKEALDQFKIETAREIGIPLTNNSDNENRTSKLNGYIGGQVGGTMVKKMIEDYEKRLK